MNRVENQQVADWNGDCLWLEQSKIDVPTESNACEETMEYLKLETEKYMQTAYKRDAVEKKMLKNRKAVRDFNTFLLGVLLMPIAAQIPTWLPMLQESPFFRLFT